MPWTTYGKQQLFQVGWGSKAVPTFYVALYSTSADPTGSPAELTLAGYARQPVSWSFVDNTHVSNLVDVSFGPLAVGSYLGVGIWDDLTAGGLWGWNDETGPITIPAGTNVVFAAGLLVEQLL